MRKDQIFERLHKMIYASLTRDCSPCSGTGELLSTRMCPLCEGVGAVLPDDSSENVLLQALYAAVIQRAVLLRQDCDHHSADILLEKANQHIVAGQNSCLRALADEQGEGPLSDIAEESMGRMGRCAAEMIKSGGISQPTPTRLVGGALSSDEIKELLEDA